MSTHWRLRGWHTGEPLLIWNTIVDMQSYLEFFLISRSSFTPRVLHNYRIHEVLYYIESRSWGPNIVSTNDLCEVMFLVWQPVHVVTLTNPQRYSCKLKIMMFRNCTNSIYHILKCGKYIMIFTFSLTLIDKNRCFLSVYLYTFIICQKCNIPRDLFIY